MKKLLLTSILFFSFLLSFCQTKKTTIAENQIGAISCEFARSIKLETNDTLNYLYFSFQNSKYKSITDLKSIFFTITKDSSDIFEFVKSLKAAYNEMGTKTDITWDKKDYRISLYSFNDKLYLCEPIEEGTGYTTLNKEQTNQLINWIEEIGFIK